MRSAVDGGALVGGEDRQLDDVLAVRSRRCRATMPGPLRTASSAGSLRPPGRPRACARRRSPAWSPAGSPGCSRDDRAAARPAAGRGARGSSGASRWTKPRSNSEPWLPTRCTSLGRRDSVGQVAQRAAGDHRDRRSGAARPARGRRRRPRAAGRPRPGRRRAARACRRSRTRPAAAGRARSGRARRAARGRALRSSRREPPCASQVQPKPRRGISAVVDDGHTFHDKHAQVGPGCNPGRGGDSACVKNQSGRGSSSR